MLIVHTQTIVPLISLVSAETGIVYDNYVIPFHTNTSVLKFVGSVSGIFCLSDQFPDYLCFWNPCVRRFKCLPSSRCKDVFPEWIYTRFAVGFGFREPAPDYRVVRVVYGCDANVGRKAPLVNENSGVPLVTASSIGTTVNENVYWVERTKAVINSDQVGIMSLDFSNEVFDHIKFCVIV